MVDFELTSEQRDMLRPGGQFVMACPGAGKTQTLVARHRRLWPSRKRGVALLSFTKRAVHEVSSRLRESPQLVHSPNYIGTFDSFLRDFVVRPSFARKHGKNPRFVDSWDDIEDRSARELSVNIAHNRWDSISIAHFYWKDSTLTLSSSGQSGKYRVIVEAVGIEKLIETARARIEELNQAGVFDASSARFYAMRALERYPQLVGRLARRFEELMIDEFQDCDDVEHHILGLVQKAGITITVVSDPNQMIYEFRGASSKLFESFLQNYDGDHTILLTNNFRSSFNICNVANSLAGNFGSPLMIASGQHASDPTPVLLLHGDVNKCRESFRQEADDLGIHEAERIVLAHRWADAAKLGKSTLPTKIFRSYLGDQIAALSASILSSRTSPDESAAQMRLLQGRILMVFNWSDENRRSSQSQKLSVLKRSPDWLRLIASRILMTFSLDQEAKTYAQSLRTSIERHLSHEQIPLVANLPAVIKCTKKEWSVLQRTVVREESSFRISTIHGAKGTEFDGVLLHVDPGPVDSWINGGNDETLRLLYVGATRARRLLGLYVTSAVDAQRIRVQLELANVQFAHTAHI